MPDAPRQVLQSTGRALVCYMAPLVRKPYIISNMARRTDDPIKTPGKSPSRDTFYMAVHHINHHRPAIFILENDTVMLQKRSDSEQGTIFGLPPR